MDSNEYLCLKWNNHSTTYKDTLYDLRLKNVLTDVTLACADKTFSVHKLVLATCSEWFLNILSELECSHPIIYLRGIKSSEVELLIEFMYTGKTDVRQNNVNELLKVAEILQIKGLGAKEPLEKTVQKDSKSSNDLLSTNNPNDTTIKRLSPLKEHSIKRLKEIKPNETNIINPFKLDPIDYDFSNRIPIIQDNKRAKIESKPPLKDPILNSRENISLNNSQYSNHPHQSESNQGYLSIQDPSSISAIPSTSQVMSYPNSVNHYTTTNSTNPCQALPSTSTSHLSSMPADSQSSISHVYYKKNHPIGEVLSSRQQNVIHPTDVSKSLPEDHNLSNIFNDSKVQFEVMDYPENVIKSENFEDLADEIDAENNVDPVFNAPDISSSLDSSTSNNNVEDGAKKYLDAFTRGANLARNHALDENMLPQKSRWIKHV